MGKTKDAAVEGGGKGPAGVLEELRHEEQNIEAFDHRIEGLKDELKALKSDRGAALSRLRAIVRESKQARLFTSQEPFDHQRDASKPPVAKE